MIRCLNMYSYISYSYNLIEKIDNILTIRHKTVIFLV